jgi:hypothetical protein
MPPTDDNAEPRLPALWRAHGAHRRHRPLGAADPTDKPGDRGADAVWRDSDGRLSVLQAKHPYMHLGGHGWLAGGERLVFAHHTFADYLLSRSEAQQVARSSVRIFISWSCRARDTGDSAADDVWERIQQWMSTTAGTEEGTRDQPVPLNLTLVGEPGVGRSSLIRHLGELLAPPALSADRWPAPSTAALPDLLAACMSHWFEAATLIDGLDELACPATAAPRDLYMELSERFASAASVRPLQAMAAAHHATAAAREARTAVVHEHPSVSREAVARFTSTWLGFWPAPEIVEATAAALLYAPLDDFDPDDNSTAVRRLRRDTRHQNRMLKPLTSTQLCHWPIDSLDRPLEVDDDGAPVTVGDTVSVPDRVDELVTRISGWNDERIGRVLGRLRADERRVALMYVHQETPTTWGQAAQACGLPAAFGERVRRKLRREGQWLLANRARGSDWPQAV